MFQWHIPRSANRHFMEPVLALQTDCDRVKAARSNSSGFSARPGTRIHIGRCQPPARSGQAACRLASPRRDASRVPLLVQFANSVDMAPGLRELIALALLVGLGWGLALAHGDLLFVAVFGGAIAMMTIEAIRRLR